MAAGHRAMRDQTRMSAILSVRDLEKTFGSVVAARDITVNVPAAADRRHHRRQRRRQDHVRQHDHRPSVADRRARSCSRARTSPACRSRAITRLGISRSFQVAQVFPTMTVIENMRVASAIARGRDSMLDRMFTPLDSARDGAEGGRRDRAVPDRALPRRARRDPAAGRAQAARHRDGGGRLAAAAAARRADQRHLHRGEVRPDGSGDVGAEDAAA